MANRIAWTFRLLVIALTLATICAAEDSNLSLNPGVASADRRPQILLADSRPSPAARADVLQSDTAYPDDFAGLEKTLVNYRNAFESMSLQQIVKVWPDLDQRHEAAFKGVFAFLQKTPTAPRLDLECAAPTTLGAAISVECRQAVTYRRENRNETVGPVRVSILLKKQSNEWTIQNMKGL